MYIVGLMVFGVLASATTPDSICQVNSRVAARRSRRGGVKPVADGQAGHGGGVTEEHMKRAGARLATGLKRAVVSVSFRAVVRLLQEREYLACPLPRFLHNRGPSAPRSRGHFSARSQQDARTDLTASRNRDRASDFRRKFDALFQETRNLPCFPGCSCILGISATKTQTRGEPPNNHWLRVSLTPVQPRPVRAGGALLVSRMPLPRALGYANGGGKIRVLEDVRIVTSRTRTERCRSNGASSSHWGLQRLR
jgi:hypothetical protein